MAYHLEDGIGKRKEIVIDGFEKGIQPSPHAGIADMKNMNINSLTGEAAVNYDRVPSIPAVSGGTFNAYLSGSLKYLPSGSNVALQVGSVVSVGSGSISGLSAGVYYVYYTAVFSGATQEIRLSSTYSITTQVTGMGLTGSVFFSTAPFVAESFIAKATEYVSAVNGYYRYYMMGILGHLWVSDPNVYEGNWSMVNPSGIATQTTGMAVSQGIVFAFCNAQTLGTNGLFWQFTNQLGNSWENAEVSFNTPVESPNPHYAITTPDENGAIYFTDSNFIGQINGTDTQGLTPQFTLASITIAGGGGSSTTGTAMVLQGSAPVTGLPVTFYPTIGGSLPNYTGGGGGTLTQGTPYYLTNVDGDVISVALTSGYTSYSLTASVPYLAQSATLSSSWTGITQVIPTIFSDGELRQVTYSNSSTAISWSGGILNTTGVGSTITTNNIGAAITIDNATFFMTSFYPATGLWTYNRQEIALPYYEVAQCLEFINAGAASIVIGTNNRSLYTWAIATSAQPTSVLSLPEANCHRILNVDNILYVFSGNKGNIYITNGSVIAGAMTVPDYIANPYGTNQDPYFMWGDVMFLRGRVWFSIEDQNAGNTTGNCGGVWSFTPTQNLFLGQDQGVQLHLENQNSYGTYNGVCDVLIPLLSQTANGPQYWSGWSSTYTNSSTSIDGSGTLPYSGALSTSVLETSQVAWIDTDIVSIGNYLGRDTPINVEYKTSRPLISGDTIQIWWRNNLTSAFVFVGQDTTVGNTSLYFSLNEIGVQWAQFRILTTTNGSTSTSWVPVTQLRVRAT